MLSVTVNTAVPLWIQDGSYRRNDLYGRSKIYNSSGTLVATISQANTTDGLYLGSWTPSAQGLFMVVSDLYFDAAYTTLAGYQPLTYYVDVNEIKTSLARILGLLHDNSVVDQQVFNGDGNLTSARLRVYDSAANATAAGATGLLYTYDIAATYTGVDVTSFKILRQ